ncbi:hypothetical protein V7128_01910 [Neobacillus vireti]|uniref:hypothetical protein n=1 Tax=Neobacillus vireti TaxID=220686 RepID=UPI002FFD6F67
MKVFKFYDAYCDSCGNWYGSCFLPPRTSNKNEAIIEMKANGWKVKDGKTLCHNCN